MNKDINLLQSAGALYRFALKGTPTGCAPYGNGHINDTFLIVCEDGNRTLRYILQSINTTVFKNPVEVVENIEKVTAFLRSQSPDPRRVLNLVPTYDGKFYYKDTNGKYWRMYDFIEDSLCLEMAESAEDFYQCAVAFGRFQRDLSQFSADQLHETIPDFHNTPKRYEAFLKAVDEDVCGRAAEVQDEIAFIRERANFFAVLYAANLAGDLPLRVTHNDTKLNNVMLDRATRTPLCVIDLDTIMPGFSVTDFGDSIRFGASTAAEDEKDLDKVWLDLALFESFTKGYLEGTGGRMKLPEIMLLPEGAKMMTIECGMRFLTDYLQGDVYFKTKYSDHNLVRCRTQLKLVADMEAHWDEMKAIVEKHAHA